MPQEMKETTTVPGYSHCNDLLNMQCKKSQEEKRYIG